MTTTWTREIAEAESASAVVEIVKRFVDGLDKTALEDVPLDCRPTRIGSTHDVAYWAFTFATASLSLEATGFLHELSLVFAEASNRIAAISLDQSRSSSLARMSLDGGSCVSDH